jgi:hypothetical protein
MLFVVLYPLIMMMKLSHDNTQDITFEMLYGELFTIYLPFKRIQFSFSCIEILRKLIISAALVYLHDKPT